MQNSEHTDAIHNVLLAIGKSVLQYQQIELQLKTLLPFVDPANDNPSTDPFLEMEILLKSRETMGPLLKRLRQSIRDDDPRDFGRHLSRILKNRNELIHEFTRLPFGGLKTVDECKEALSHLAKQKEQAAPIIDMLRLVSFEFIKHLDDENLTALRH